MLLVVGYFESISTIFWVETPTVSALLRIRYNSISRCPIPGAPLAHDSWKIILNAFTASSVRFNHCRPLTTSSASRTTSVARFIPLIPARHANASRSRMYSLWPGPLWLFKSDVFSTAFPLKCIIWTLGFDSGRICVDATSDETLAPGKATFRYVGVLSRAMSAIIRAGIWASTIGLRNNASPLSNSNVARKRIKIHNSVLKRQYLGTASIMADVNESMSPRHDAPEPSFSESSRARYFPCR